MQLRLLFPLLTGLALASWAQTPVRICEPATEVRKELSRVQLEALTSTGPQRAGLVKKLAEAAVAKYPDDYFAHRAYQTLGMFGMRDRAANRLKMIERYRSLADAHSGNPKYAVLYAHALFGANTPLAIEVLKKAAAGQDDPQVQLALADVYSFGKFADRAQSRAHVEAYFTACPAPLDRTALSMLGRSVDNRGWAAPASGRCYR